MSNHTSTHVIVATATAMAVLSAVFGVVLVVLVVLGARLLVVGAPFGPLLILLGSALIAPVLPRKAS